MLLEEIKAKIKIIFQAITATPVSGALAQHRQSKTNKVKSCVPPMACDLDVQRALHSSTLLFSREGRN